MKSFGQIERVQHNRTEKLQRKQIQTWKANTYLYLLCGFGLEDEEQKRKNRLQENHSTWVYRD